MVRTKVDGHQSDDGILEHECAITTIGKLYEQKPTEWSEEDERYKNTIIRAIHGAGNITPIDGELAEKWLKSLRPQKQWEPTEEQITELDHLISGCSCEVEIIKELKEELEKLKGL